MIILVADTVSLSWSAVGDAPDFPTHPAVDEWTEFDGQDINIQW